MEVQVQVVPNVDEEQAEDEDQEQEPSLTINFCSMVPLLQKVLCFLLKTPLLFEINMHMYWFGWGIYVHMLLSPRTGLAAAISGYSGFSICMSQPRNGLARDLKL